ncbi:MAG: damage-control phosphatase ARMT1 family protein [Thermodesulfobacteriota bacterium]
MKPDLECAPCLLKWVYERAGILASEERRFRLIRSILKTLSREFDSEANLGLITNRIIGVIEEFVLQAAPYYNKFKSRSNQTAKRLLPPAKIFIDKGKTEREKFERACRLASASNVAPIGGPSESFKFREVVNLLAGRKPSPIISSNVFEVAKRANNVLYITDNAGEIGFDTLLISRLKEMGLKITLVVKEPPFFEDATMEDASFFRLDRYVDNLLSVKGLFVPTHSPSPLRVVFNKTDLIISKGTGNYEALQSELGGKPCIHMLKIKCEPIATKLGVGMGSFVVKTCT